VLICARDENLGIPEPFAVKLDLNVSFAKLVDLGAHLPWMSYAHDINFDCSSCSDACRF
jgi:hypothetical protein